MRNGALVVIGLVAAGKKDQILAVMALLGRRGDDAVGDEIIDVRRSQGVGKAQVIDLYRRRAPGENPYPHRAEIAVEIDENINLLIADD